MKLIIFYTQYLIRKPTIKMTVFYKKQIRIIVNFFLKKKESKKIFYLFIEDSLYLYFQRYSMGCLKIYMSNYLNQPHTFLSRNYNLEVGENEYGMFERIKPENKKLLCFDTRGSLDEIYLSVRFLSEQPFPWH